MKITTVMIYQMINDLNERYPNQMIKIRDEGVLLSCYGQYEQNYCDDWQLGLKIACSHPLVNGNKRLGSRISFFNNPRKTFEDWLNDFDKEQ